MGRTKRNNSIEKSEKKLYEKWQSWVALISAVIVLFGAILDIPKRIIETYKTIFPTENICLFNGRVIDANNNPVIGAEIIVQGEKGTGITDDNGEFNFKVKSKAGTRVQIFIKKDGVIKYNGSETLPGPTVIKLKELP